jgi:hypothetical protein
LFIDENGKTFIFRETWCQKSFQGESVLANSRFKRSRRMKRFTGKQILLAVISLALVFGFSLIKVGGVVAAGTEAVQFNVSTSMADNLSLLKGKTVTVYLVSGQTITGTVNDVKGNLLHLGKLSQKDFFDALIAVDRISAIDARVRGQ